MNGTGKLLFLNEIIWEKGTKPFKRVFKHLALLEIKTKSFQMLVKIVAIILIKIIVQPLCDCPLFVRVVCIKRKKCISKLEIIFSRPVLFPSKIQRRNNVLLTYSVQKCRDLSVGDCYAVRAFMCGKRKNKNDFYRGIRLWNCWRLFAVRRNRWVFSPENRLPTRSWKFCSKRTGWA